MKEYARFSDFFTTQHVLDGEKTKITSILNKEIIILDFKVKKSRYETDRYCAVQFAYPEDENTHYVFFTGSGVIINMLEESKAEEHLPFLTTVRQINKYYVLS